MELVSQKLQSNLQMWFLIAVRNNPLLIWKEIQTGSEPSEPSTPTPAGQEGAQPFPNPSTCGTSPTTTGQLRGGACTQRAPKSNRGEGFCHIPLLQNPSRGEGSCQVALPEPCWLGTLRTLPPPRRSCSASCARSSAGTGPGSRTSRSRGPGSRWRGGGSKR